MSKVTYSFSVSADGFINDASGSLGWAQIDEEIHTWFNDRAREADAFLYGRRLWETMAAYWPDAATDGDASPAMLDFARIWNAKPKVVFSSTLESVEHGARLERGPILDALPRLREEFPGELEVGGAALAADLVQGGLIDEYRLVVHPVALGAGTPFFPPLDAPLHLRLVESRPFASGAVLLRYEPSR